MDYGCPNCLRKADALTANPLQVAPSYNNKEMAHTGLLTGLLTVSSTGAHNHKLYSVYDHSPIFRGRSS